MNKTALIILSIALVFVFGFIFLSKSSSNSDKPSLQNVEVKNGIQYVRINAKGGYVPAVTIAQAGIPTKLLIETKGTFDCSSSLAIPSISYQKILPQTGETEIDIGVPKAGEPLRGVCGMGMYNFQVDFQ